ncbi:MAG TPA: PilZ domain-containing protein [Dissulfurispiraceae bacterium]|nr:PilZ domain-containing protein [Dissulfurispiraceae bacterium]
MTDYSEKNLREFSRVDVVIPFEVRLVQPDEKNNIRSIFVGETRLPNFPTPPDVEDIILAEWLKMLNSKLDAVLAALSSREDKAQLMPQKKINVSGGGLCFDSSDEYKVGDLLEMKIMLPSLPSNLLYVYGEVVNVRAAADYYHTAVKFVAIDDEIRDEIVKLVFKTQRNILRRKRG